MTGVCAGAARVDITPPIATPLAGYPPIGLWDGGPSDHRGYIGRTGLFEGVHDPVYARALVVENDGAVAALVAMDVAVVEGRFVARVRREASRRWGLSPEAVVIAASHSHAGPDYSSIWETAPETVEEFVLDGVLNAIASALASRRPARFGVGEGRAEGITANRRDPSRPVDPRLPVLRVDGNDGAPIAVVYSFACHPIVAGTSNRMVSAEFPGVASSIVEQALGGVVLFLNGCAGNINPRAFPYSAGRNIVEVARELRAAGLPEACRTLAEVSRFGSVLGSELLRVAAQIDATEGGGVQFWRREVEAPVKSPDDLELYLRHVPHTAPAAETLRSTKALITEVGALRIGPLTLLTLPGEPFVEIGLELERRAVADGAAPGSVRAIGYANDYPGYLLPPDQYRENRYETVATALAAEGAQAIVDAAAQVWTLANAGR
jgi:hypothetical protein